MLTSKANKKLYPLYTGAGNLNTSFNLILTNWLNPLCFGWRTQLVAMLNPYTVELSHLQQPQRTRSWLQWLCITYVRVISPMSEHRAQWVLQLWNPSVFNTCFLLFFSAQALEMSNAFTTPIIYTIFNRSFRVGIIICQLAYWSCRQCSRWRIEQAIQ